MSEILVSTIVNTITILIVLAVNFILIGISGRIVINKIKKISYKPKKHNHE